MYKIILSLITFSFLSGCVLPLKVAEPLKVKLVDSKTEKPLSNVKYFRFVCDIHSYSCSSAIIDQGITKEDGYINLSSDRKWGSWFPAPGGMPVPNHQIAFWKEGYYAYLFTQYDGDIEKYAKRVNRADFIHLVNSIPKYRKYLNSEDAVQYFYGGVFKMERISSGTPKK